jgi:hypothetical protein
VQVDIPGKQVQVEYKESQLSVERMKDILQEEHYPGGVRGLQSRRGDTHMAKDPVADDDLE